MITSKDVVEWIENKMVMTYDYAPEKGTVEVIEDPKVPGTFAARFKEDGYDIDLLFVTSEAARTVPGGSVDQIGDVLEMTLEEVEFEAWPPVSGNLRFFI